MVEQIDRSPLVEASAPAPDAAIADRLRDAGLRPTRQRLSIAAILFDGQHKHMSAEAVHAAAQQDGAGVSLATVYNALHQFTEAGLLRELVIEPGRSYFDTNVDDHHHVFNETTGALDDIAPVRLGRLPAPPVGTQLTRVDVIIRVAETDADAQQS